jgi:hypothetical protein
MFMIPSFYEDVPTKDDAINMMTRLGGGGLLAGMKAFDVIWEDHIAQPDADDDEFFSRWCYEANAYNVVYENFGKLFAAEIKF